MCTNFALATSNLQSVPPQLSSHTPQLVPRQLFRKQCRCDRIFAESKQLKACVFALSLAIFFLFGEIDWTKKKSFNTTHKWKQSKAPSFGNSGEFNFEPRRALNLICWLWFFVFVLLSRFFFFSFYSLPKHSRSKQHTNSTWVLLIWIMEWCIRGSCALWRSQPESEILQIIVQVTTERDDECWDLFPKYWKN